MKHKQNFFPVKYHHKFIYDIKVPKICYRKRSTTSCFGLYTCKITRNCVLNSYQIEFMRRKLKRRLKKKAMF